MLWARLYTDPPCEARAIALAGAHRPLNGEVAHLTLTLDVTTEERAYWQIPPLGAPVRVFVDHTILLDGALAQVTWTAAQIVITIEG